MCCCLRCKVESVLCCRPIRDLLLRPTASAAPLPFQSGAHAPCAIAWRHQVETASWNDFTTLSAYPEGYAADNALSSWPLQLAGPDTRWVPRCAHLSVHTYRRCLAVYAANGQPVRQSPVSRTHDGVPCVRPCQLYHPVPGFTVGKLGGWTERPSVLFTSR